MAIDNKKISKAIEEYEKIAGKGKVLENIKIIEENKEMIGDMTQAALEEYINFTNDFREKGKEFPLGAFLKSVISLGFVTGYKEGKKINQN